MRVLELSWEYPPVIAGGLGRHVRGLSRALVAEGVAVDVLTRGPVAGTERDRRVAVHRVAQPAFPSELDAFLAWVAALNRALVARARELLAEGRYDVVHSHDWLVADAAREIVRRERVPWLVTVHATEHGRHDGRVAAHPQSTIHAAERRMTRDADRLITCSEWMHGHVASTFGVDRAAITALPNGIDLDDVVPTHDPAALRARLAPAGERLVLLSGRLVYEKGFDLALDALAPVVRARDDVRYLVAGGGPAQEDLHAHCASLGITTHGEFLGWLEDDALPGLYAACDVCVVPSRYEPFGIVALEAMAGGCPCVVADTGGLREIVPAGELVGLRVDCTDPGALGAAISRLLDDEALRARLSTAGRAHVRGYDWAHVARATVELLAPIGGRSSPRPFSAAGEPTCPPSR